MTQFDMCVREPIFFQKGRGGGGGDFCFDFDCSQGVSFNSQNDIQVPNAFPKKFLVLEVCCP
jgi:hypothetical protein